MNAVASPREVACAAAGSAGELAETAEAPTPTPAATSSVLHIAQLDDDPTG